MEDISRELEREIAQSKPSPYKKSRTKSVLIIDEFGEIKPGNHLKRFMALFSVLAAVCLVAAIVFFLLFSRLSAENRLMHSMVASLEQRVRSLVDEKEVLMARLVISGKDPALDKVARNTSGSKQTVSEGVLGKRSDKKPVETGKKNPTEKLNTDDATPSSTAVESVVPAADKLGTGKNENQAGEGETGERDPISVVKKVAVEKFSVTREQGQGDLLVRFDIRNVSPEPGEVSGRIFTILKPGEEAQEQWLVVPHSSLDQGMPSQYRKGQYFSISHFKPVKFRIENPAGPSFFKKAAILIYNDEGNLMFKNDISIDEADQG